MIDGEKATEARSKHVPSEEPTRRTSLIAVRARSRDRSAFDEPLDLPQPLGDADRARLAWRTYARAAPGLGNVEGRRSSDMRWMLPAVLVAGAALVWLWIGSPGSARDKERAQKADVAGAAAVSKDAPAAVPVVAPLLPTPATAPASAPTPPNAAAPAPVAAAVDDAKPIEPGIVVVPPAPEQAPSTAEEAPIANDGAEARAPTEPAPQAEPAPATPAADPAPKREAPPARTPRRKAPQLPMPARPAPPDDTRAPHAADYRKIPRHPDDRAPVGGVGEHGVHVDTFVLANSAHRGRCSLGKDRFSVAADGEADVCIRAVHRRVAQTLVLVWRKDGRVKQRRFIKVPARHHAYSVSSKLSLRGKAPGNWEVVVLTESNVELARGQFEIVP